MNNVIGRGNELPWSLPKDLQHFKNITESRPIIMGRKTYESIGRPLPNRHNIIVTKQTDFTAEGCSVVHSVDEAIGVARQHLSEHNEICVIGGAELYREFLPRADRLEITEVMAHIENGDAFFPPFNEEEWGEKVLEEYSVDDEHEYPFTFVRYTRSHR